ncbi:MAG: hypothetical protein NUW22_12340 [Acidobacteria bacterium]|nr:hypothetical protein [Acidobacteriota bacterium]
MRLFVIVVATFLVLGLIWCWLNRRPSAAQKNLTTVGNITAGEWLKDAGPGQVRFYSGASKLVGVIYADKTVWIDPTLSETAQQQVRQQLMQGKAS